MSQFHYGSIQIDEVTIEEVFRAVSQFHYGSIQIKIILFIVLVTIGLNSTMVRFKLE